MGTMKPLQHLFNANIRWANRMVADDPDFFKRLASLQQPEYLWIGCSDSRVPANQITGLNPGEVFVHRNIANLVNHTDLNCLSVMEYAVKVLKVKHIIVCGHYGCGGVLAAIQNQKIGVIDNWLLHIRDTYHKHKNMLDPLGADDKVNKLCELNVVEQVQNVCHSPVIQKAWESGQELSVHGWIYKIQDGIIHELISCITNTKEAKDFSYNLFKSSTQSTFPSATGFNENREGTDVDKSNLS